LFAVIAPLGFCNQQCCRQNVLGDGKMAGPWAERQKWWQKRQSIFFNILSFKNNGTMPCSILPTCLSMLLLTGFDWI